MFSKIQLSTEIYFTGFLILQLNMFNIFKCSKRCQNRFIERKKNTEKLSSLQPKKIRLKRIDRYTNYSHGVVFHSKYGNFEQEIVLNRAVF